MPPQPQLRDYTVTGKKSIKQDAIVIKSACKELGIMKTVWYEARNVVLKAFVENDQQERSMHIQGIASSRAIFYPSSGRMACAHLKPLHTFRADAMRPYHHPLRPNSEPPPPAHG